MRRSVAALALLALALAACGGNQGVPEVTDARIGQPTGPNAALYFTATADAADRLLGAETDSAVSVEVHETTTGDDATMGMRAIAGVNLPAGEPLVLEPGGVHLMLIDAERMDVGDTIQVTLRWENAGEMLIEAEVVDPAETMDHDS